VLHSFGDQRGPRNHWRSWYKRPPFSLWNALFTRSHTVGESLRFTLEPSLAAELDDGFTVFPFMCTESGEDIRLPSACCLDGFTRLYPSFHCIWSERYIIVLIMNSLCPLLKFAISPFWNMQAEPCWNHLGLSYLSDTSGQQLN
jgi:hypothetical protein